MLAIPSIIIGAILAKSILYSSPGLLGKAITTSPAHYGGWIRAVGESIHGLPFWFAVSGIVCAWLFYIRFPHWSVACKKRLRWVHVILEHKYGFDLFYNWFFVRGGHALSCLLYRFADTVIIDGWMVNGTGRSIKRVSQRLRMVQSGYLYHYAFAMIIGLTGFLALVMGWV